MTETEWKASGLYGLIYFSAMAAGIYAFGWQSQHAAAIAIFLTFLLNTVTRLNARNAETKILSIRD